jgi:hypothetical protein
MPILGLRLIHYLAAALFDSAKHSTRFVKMISNQIRFTSTPWLSVALVLALLRADVLAAPAILSSSTNRRVTSLTGRRFGGSDRNQQNYKALAPSSDFADPIVSIAGRLDDGRYPWKRNIVTTVFWIGEAAAKCNPVANTESAWDLSWSRHYGGYDSPTERARYIPAKFLPNQNPFYVALPCNDVSHKHTRPEASRMIPWFKSSFVRDGESVCKDHWLEIRHGNRICFAQWEDVGPFRVDRWQYVFGNELPFPNRNHNAGLDVSPAVRDYLGISGMDVCDWKFVDLPEVPNGPWAWYGRNNTLARRRCDGTVIAQK